MLAKDKAMEFWWRQHSDTAGSSDMLTHLNPFYAYDVPHTWSDRVCKRMPY